MCESFPVIQIHLANDGLRHSQLKPLYRDPMNILNGYLRRTETIVISEKGKKNVKITESDVVLLTILHLEDVLQFYVCVHVLFNEWLAKYLRLENVHCVAESHIIHSKSSWELIFLNFMFLCASRVLHEPAVSRCSSSHDLSSCM